MRKPLWGKMESKRVRVNGTAFAVPVSRDFTKPELAALARMPKMKRMRTLRRLLNLCTKCGQAPICAESINFCAGCLIRHRKLARVVTGVKKPYLK